MSAKRTLELCRNYVLSILQYADANKQVFPEKMYNATVDLVGDVAIRMRQFKDALSGKADPYNTSMQIQHFNLAQDLRLKNPEKYKQLVFFATIYPTMTFQERQKRLLAFFQEF